MEVDDILEQVDILEYISQYCDFEEKNGEYWALSPFKEEKTPSFSVNTEKQRFYDFSSGAGGNLIHFIRRYNDCGFIDAINILKKYANITEDSERAIGRLESTKVAKRFKRKSPTSKESKSVVLSPNYMERYEFDEDKLQAWVDEGIDLETMKKFGVCYDSFSNRIVFPIKNYAGDIINVCGRTLEKDFKEKGLRKYTYFKPFGGSLDTLFGFSDNRQSIMDKREVIVFEGSKSVMLAHSWGIENTCAILTSHLNPQQFLFLVKLGVRVVFALDKEIDIYQDRHIQKLKRYVTIEHICDGDDILDEKMSPVDMGKEMFLRLYEERRRF